MSDLLCLRSSRFKYNTSTSNYLLVVFSSTLRPKVTTYVDASDSDSDSLFTKFYNKESVSKAVSIQT